MERHAPMKSLKRRVASEQGNTLLIVMLMLLAMTAVGTGLLTVASVEVDVAGNQRAGEVALYYADSGIRAGIDLLTQQVSGGSEDLTSTPTLIAETQVPLDGSGTNFLPGASYNVTGAIATDSDGQTVECNVVGMEEGFALRRFILNSTGRLYPAGVTADGANTNQAYSIRTIEALVVIPGNPQQQMCPPGTGGQY